MEDVSVLQAIFLRENNLRHLSSKLADPAKKERFVRMDGAFFFSSGDLNLPMALNKKAVPEQKVGVPGFPRLPQLLI